MRITTSPGMRRIIEKTMMLTSTSVGIARPSRRNRYDLIAPPCPASPLDPGEHEPVAEREPVVVPEALHLRRVRDVLRRGREIHVVRLVGEMPLDVVDD